MTTFIVSLFLPYTIDFDDPSQPNRRPSPPLPSAGLKSSSVSDLRDLRATLLDAATPLPETPGAAAANDYFFSHSKPPVDSYFPKPHDPRALVRSDSYAPDWNKEKFFNQPRSRADEAPPDTILEYAKAIERVEAAKRARNRKGSPKRKLSGDKNRSWGSKWMVEPAVQGNGGLANAIKASARAGQMGEILNVGLLGFPTDELDEETKDDIHQKLEEEYESLTVYVNDSDFDGHYAHFCKTILWPIFHYQVPDHPKSKAYQDHSWVYYVNVNQAFADKVIKNYKRGDIIWVHDYHLLLVPAMIRKKLPDAQIGFFLHTAFPSSEVFRCLAMRKELLEGLLGANLVAFQIKEYAHHFLQTCSRLLNLEAIEEGVQLDDKFVNVTSLPMGIYPQGLLEALEDPDVAWWINSMQERYQGKRLIVARDKLDHVGGIRQKLLAFELFLNKYPEYKEKVVLIQVATSSTEDNELAATISEIVTRIDAVHSTLAHQPLVFLRQDISFSQYLALLSVADALMITSLREGMNLTCHEFLMCQDGKRSNKKHGPIILSEFTGSASVIDSWVLEVNPWDYQKCAQKIKEALEMPSSDRDYRYNKLREIVLEQDGAYWMNSLSKQLAQVHEQHYQRDTMSIPRLSTSKLVENYKRANKRLFLLDYEGTLTTYGSVNNTILSNPQRLVNTLSDLISDPRNVVYVMSGRTMSELSLIFTRVAGLGLIAENGCFLREHTTTDEWIAFADMEKAKQWKDSVKNILQYYQERVEGSWLEERHCVLIFHYDKSDDQEAATRQAGDCANHINDACQSSRVRAVPARGYVIVEPIDWDKRTAANHILTQMQKSQDTSPDFLMVAGNDRDDEVVFKWAKELNNSVQSVNTVSVGSRNTDAMATLTQGTTGLLSVLGRLAKVTRSP